MFNLDDYEPVDERIAKFWAKYEDGKIETDLVFNDGGMFIVKAWGYRNDGTLIATGYADESKSEKGVNANFALPNAETSAIGRMLANAGFAAKVGKRPSREEMTKVNRVAVETPQETVTPVTAVTPSDPWTISDAIGVVSDTLGAVATQTRPKCKHGERTWLSGVSPKTNRAYKGWACPEKAKAQQCATDWIND